MLIEVSQQVSKINICFSKLGYKFEISDMSVNSIMNMLVSIAVLNVHPFFFKIVHCFLAAKAVLLKTQRLCHLEDPSLNILYGTTSLFIEVTAEVKRHEQTS